jgi:hypothetical protein
LAERARTVDRVAMFGGKEGWRNNPDKFILDIAGVTGAGNDYYCDLDKPDDGAD